MNDQEIEQLRADFPILTKKVYNKPLIYFDNEGMYPLSVTLTDVGSSDYGIIFACGVIFMIPALLIYLYGHRDIDSPFVGTDKG